MHSGAHVDKGPASVNTRRSMLEDRVREELDYVQHVCMYDGYRASLKVVIPLSATFH